MQRRDALRTLSAGTLAAGAGLFNASGADAQATPPHADDAARPRAACR